MDTLDIDGLKRLSASEGGHHVSIYLTTHNAAPENQQDPIRFKNLLRRAEKRLTDAGERPADVRAFMEPAWRLVDDGLFWRPRPGGLAVFLSADGLLTYRFAVTFAEEGVVNSRFYVKPLMGAVDSGERFYVLALSQDHVKLYRGTRSGIEEVPLPDSVPPSREAALRNDENFDDTRQWHTMTGPAGPRTGRRGAQFFGSGVDAKGDTREMIHFLHKVAGGVYDVLKHDTAPMVLATVDYVVPMYREANPYRGLLDDAISGNPELLGPSELHERAWQLVQPLFESARRQALERFNEYEGTGHASSDAADVVRASAYGRVDSLFVRQDGHVWGSFDPQTGEVRLAEEDAPGTEDLTDFAVMQTVLNGGSVFPLGVRDAPLAAVFRY
ncbi:MAG: hypothetical protein IBX62_03265 [Coriobacteriia bacterium]|nr:hypothetical protein [Coriobacteriia bacterium]